MARTSLGRNAIPGIADWAGITLAELPVIPASQTSGFATVATTGAYSDLTGAPTLATVATTGQYGDLIGLPTLGGAAALNVGTTAGTVAAGNDSRFSASVTGIRKSSGGGSTDVATVAADVVGLWSGTPNGSKFLRDDGTLAAAGAGTVTDVSVVTAAGVSGSVATSTTTPAITITLGAITPASVASVGTVTGSNLSGTNTGDQTSVSGNAGTATALQTARNINGVSFDGTANITVPAAGSTLTDTVPVPKGGTALTTIANAAILVANATDTLTALVVGALDSVRRNSGNTAWETFTPSAGGGLTQPQVMARSFARC